MACPLPPNVTAPAGARISDHRWQYAAYGYGVLVSAGVGYLLLWIPIQVTDCFANMLALDQPFGGLMRQTLADPSYFRPGLWTALKAVYELSGGDYYHWFRLTHAAQVLAAVVLFVRLAAPGTVTEAAALPLGLAALVGSHTFAWTVREAFPINTFLTIVVCCAAAANLAWARHRWWTDAAAAGLLAIAVLTVESGVLVWVILATGYALGLAGVSRRGLVAATVILAAYFLLRGSLAVFPPELGQREAGFGFSRRSAGELRALFGANPLPFYAYNVAASIAGVLFAEPRDGVWRLVRAAVTGARDLPSVVNVAASTLGTGVIAWFAWTRRAAWARRRFEHRDRLVLIFVAVLLANAAISFAYTKDVIMSPAGFFFAAALFAGASQWLDVLAERTASPSLAAWLLLALLSSAWAVRFVGLHAALAGTAITVREQWAQVDDWMVRVMGPLDDRGERLLHHLQRDAIERLPMRPPLRDRWSVLFDLD